MYKFTEINGKTNSEHSLKSKVVVMHNPRQREKCVRESFPGDKIWFWRERSQKFQMLPKNCLLVKIRSHIGCICLIFLHTSVQIWECERELSQEIKSDYEEERQEWEASLWGTRVKGKIRRGHTVKGVQFAFCIVKSQKQYATSSSL